MNDEDFVRFFGRHLVSLAGWYRTVNLEGEDTSQTKFFSYSGFILSIRGMWCLATAGHIIDKLEQHLKNESIRVTNYALLDDFGPNVKSHDPIPFDYAKALKFYIDNREAGLDFALVLLSPYYQGLLKANGIIPVYQENWEKQHEVEFGHHIMIGLPQTSIETSIRENQGKRLIDAFVRPMTIDIEKLDKAPDYAKETHYPRFVGKIGDDFDDIDGISGGPILGFNKEGDRYWIVAIQSSWLRESKIVFGCPIPVIAEFVDKMLSDTPPHDEAE
jgi:hypothetical protein